MSFVWFVFRCFFFLLNIQIYNEWFFKNMGEDLEKMTKLPPEGQTWFPSQTSNLMSEKDFHRKDEEEEPELKRFKMMRNDDHSYSIPGDYNRQREYQDGQQFILKNSEKYFDPGRSSCLFEKEYERIFDSEKHRIDTEKSNLELKNDEGQNPEIHPGQLFDSEQLQTSTERSGRRRPPKGYYFLGRPKKEKSKVIDSPKKARDRQKKEKLINYSIDVFGSMELTEKEMSPSFSTQVKQGKMNTSNSFHSMKPSQQIEINKNVVSKKRKKSDKSINFSRDVFDSMLSEDTQKLDEPSIEFERSVTNQPKTDGEIKNLSTDVIDCTKLSEKEDHSLIQSERETSNQLESGCTKEKFVYDKETTNQRNERGAVESQKIESSRNFQYKELPGNKSFTKQNIKKSSNFMTEKNQDKNSPLSDVVGSTQDSENIKRSTFSNPECEKSSERFYCILSKIKEKPSKKFKTRLSKNCDYLKESESQEMFKPFNFPTFSTSNVKKIHKPGETILPYSAQDVFEPMKSEPTKMAIQQNKQNIYSTLDALEYSIVQPLIHEQEFKSPQLTDSEGIIGVSKDQSVSDIMMSDKSESENGIFQPEGSKNDRGFQGFLTSFQDGNKNKFSSIDQNSLDGLLEPLASRESKCFEFKEFRLETKAEKKILRYSNEGGQYIDPVTHESEVPDDVMTFSLGSYSIQSQHEDFKIPAKQPNAVKDEFDFLKVEMFHNYEKFNSQNILAEDKTVSTDDLINEMKNILEESNFETENMIEGCKQIKIEKLKIVPEGLIKNIKMLRIKSKDEFIDRKTSAKYTFTYKDFLW